MAVAFFVVAFLVRFDDLHRSSTADQVRVTILPIGAGSCAVVELPGRRVYIIDAGSSSLPDPFGRSIEPFLRSRGIRHIDGLFLSHADYDHFSAATDLLAHYTVSNVYLAPQFFDSATSTPAVSRLMGRLNQNGPVPHIVSTGQNFVLTDDTQLNVLWPDPKFDASANDTSLVLRLEYHHQRVLFTGDIEAAAQRQLLDNAADLQAQVLVAPHHGSSARTTAEFVAAVNPQQIVSSNGRRLTQHQRDFDDLVTVPHLRTSQVGAITITLGPAEQFNVTSYLAVDPLDE